MSGEQSRISVVIPTYQRCEACKRAVRSALEQERPPLEVLVCDDGSTDQTRDELESWAADEPRLKYLRLPRNQGAPAPARNLGLRNAGGDWVAFLDDDDVWRPSKLRVQGEVMATGRYDLVASDAERSSGGAYFGLADAAEPVFAEFLRHNPIITSTAVARRSLLVAAGGFPESAARMRITGVEDYGAWLRMASRGARVIVLPDPLTLYDDQNEGSVSKAAARQEAEVAALRWQLWGSRIGDLAALRAAAAGSFHAGATWLRARRERARAAGCRGR